METCFFLIRRVGSYFCILLEGGKFHDYWRSEKRSGTSMLSSVYVKHHCFLFTLKQVINIRLTLVNKWAALTHTHTHQMCGLGLPPTGIWGKCKGRDVASVSPVHWHAHKYILCSKGDLRWCQGAGSSWVSPLFPFLLSLSPAWPSWSSLQPPFFSDSPSLLAVRERSRKYIKF